MSEENVEIARQALDAWARRDVDAVIRFFHDDSEWYPALTPGGMEGAVYRGPHGMRRWFAELDEAWSELSVEVSEFRDVAADRVLQLGRFHAVGRKSGVPIERPQALLLAFRDKKVVAAWGYASHQEALEAAGLSE